jgi:two-component system, cell cycle sensor histidine kinase and response regulator CckA
MKPDSARPPAPPPSGRWILVVDDDMPMLGLIEVILQAEGWTVYSATSAAAASAIVDSARTPPALLISDVMMPGMDGLQFTRRLLVRMPGLKAIVVSAQLDEAAWWPEDLQHCPFLAKPFRKDELVNAVRAALGS